MSQIVKIVAKFRGNCFECDGRIDVGDDAFYDTVEARTYCEPCGEDLK